MKAKLLTVALTLGVCLAGAGVCRADDTVGSFHRSFQVSGAVRLEVATGAGSIQVTGAPGTAVTVDGTIHQSDSFFGGADPAQVHEMELHPPIDQSGNMIDIHRLPDGWGEHLWISYIITTPADTQLRAHSGSGTIEVAGLSGGADLEAGSGRLRVAELGGRLSAETGSGSISFDRIGGEAQLSTGSGSIEGNEVAGRLGATSGSGRISVRQLDQGGEIHTASGGIELDQVAGDLSAHAASGSIVVSGVLAGTHTWNLSAASGSIHLSLPAQTVANVRLQTASGRLTVNHPMRMEGELGRHIWEGVMGDGTPTASLTAHTASGSIRIN